MKMKTIRRTNQIFLNGSNLQINGGQFINSEKFNYISRTESALDILYDHTAPGALLDSKERFDAPKCDDNTRKVILQTLMEWIVGGNKSSSSIMWLHGPAGSGKSALAQTIAEKCRDAGILAACFFFSRNSSSSNRSDGRLVIATLVHQLVSSFPRIRSYIQKYVDNNPSIFDRGIEAQAENLLVLPVHKVRRSVRYFLARLFSRTAQPRLFVVDGLDECNDIRVQCEILDALATATRDLGLPFRFLVASRPEAHICRRFDHGSLLSSVLVRQLNLVHDIHVDNDIRAYLSSEFQKIISTHPMKDYISSLWPDIAAIETLVNRSSGQFVYASTVIKYIQSTKHRPVDRLRIILGISPTPANETPYAALDALYTHIFFSVEDITRVMQIFGLLVVPHHSTDEKESFKTPDMIDQLLSFQSGDTQLILSDLLSVVAIGDRYTPIKLHHASLNDYLLDRARSQSLSVDLSQAHSQLAGGYLRLSQAQDLSSTVGARDFDNYFKSFRFHYDRASLDPAAELVQNLEKMDLLRIYHHFLSNFPLDNPKYSQGGLYAGDFMAMTTFSRVHQLWKSRAMAQLLYPFTRTDLPNQDRIYIAFMRNLYNTYPPINPVISESLTSLLTQPRFRSYIFRVCDHTNHILCHGCNKISCLASQLSYQLIYAFMLHPLAESREQWSSNSAADLSEKCAEQAYVCLTYVYGIIDAILASHRTTRTRITKLNARRAEIKARTRHDSYADYYFEAALDCAIILLPYADCTTAVAKVLEKFSATEPWRQHYVLKRFSPQFELLHGEIDAYRRRADFASELHF